MIWMGGWEIYHAQDQALRSGPPVMYRLAEAH
jgi:hypothetical protein